MEDFVIATGRTESLEYFVSRAFSFYDLNWRDYVNIDPSFLRPSDIRISCGDPERAKLMLGWSAKHDVDGVIECMSKAALAGVSDILCKRGFSC